MIKQVLKNRVLWVCLTSTLLLPAWADATETYVIDPDHSSISFRIEHLGITFVYGVFPNAGGFYTFDDDDLDNASIWIKVKVADIDTGIEKRDRHLLSPDFFDAKRFPHIIFKSLSIASSGDGQYTVTGELSLHGITKRLAVQVSRTGFHQDPSGEVRSGFETSFSIKRSDFGMHYMTVIADRVELNVNVEGVRLDNGNSAGGLDYTFRLECE